MSRSLTIGFVQISRGILWLAGIFALVGWFWRPHVEITPLSGCLMTLILAAWVEFLISLSSNFTQPKNFIGTHELLIPAVFFGFLLPFPFPIFYLVLLTIAERARYYWKRTSPQKNFSLPKTLLSQADQIPLDENFSDKDFSDEEQDDSITQQIVRRQTEEGTDRLEGNYLIEFRHDQSTATIHVPFIPAFESVPKISVFCLDDVEVKWTIFEPQNFGVRIDLKKITGDTPKIRIMVIAEQVKGFSS